MPKRKYSSSSDSSLSSTVSKHSTTTRKPGIFSGLKLYVIQSKFDATELELLTDLVVSNGAKLMSNPETAEIIITRIGMLKRLERHISLKTAKSKVILIPGWVTQSVISQKLLSFEDFYAICPLKKCTLEYCLEHNQKMQNEDQPMIPPPKHLSYTSKFAVQRASPLISHNQDFLHQLAVIREARFLDNEKRSFMSYTRAIGILKAYPHKIERIDQVKSLPFIGPKLISMLDEFLSKGEVGEAERVKASTRYGSLKEFTSIHGIGPLKASQLYREGCRSLEDLGRIYGSDLESSTIDPPRWSGAVSGVREALELRNDLRQTISRSEVEQIDGIIGAELEALEKGCVRIIVGGYRRGKQECNDIDIVFSHPDLGKEINLCKRLVEALGKKGLVTHVFHASGFRSTHPLHMPAGASKPDHPHWDSLDKALVVFRLPQTSSIHRRVDLIFAPINLYWTAVVGWTGSSLFERDLRLWAKQKMGMKFDSGGITRRRDSKLFFPMSEAAVFELLGLECIDPTLRNADL